jgi:hypothetical protein
VGDSGARVVLVNCRLGTILGEKSEVHRVWSALCSAVIAACKEERPVSQILRVYLLWECFVGFLSQGGRNSAREWKYVLDEARGILKDLNVDYVLVDDLLEIVPDNARFDASSFWRDWDRRSK